MDEIGISETRRLQGLGDQQRKKLFEKLDQLTSPAGAVPAGRPAPAPVLAAAVILVVSGPGGVGKGTVVGAPAGASRPVAVAVVDDPAPPARARPRTPTCSSTGTTFLARVDAGGFVEQTEFPGTGQLTAPRSLGRPRPARRCRAGDRGRRRPAGQGAPPRRRAGPHRRPVPGGQEARLRAGATTRPHRSAAWRSAPPRSALGRRDSPTHVVVNDDVDRAAGEVAGILERHAGDECAGTVVTEPPT